MFYSHLGAARRRHRSGRGQFVRLKLGTVHQLPMFVHVRTGTERLRTIPASVQIGDASVDGHVLLQCVRLLEHFATHQTLVGGIAMDES